MADQDLSEDSIFSSFLKTPLPLAKGTAPSDAKSPRVAADANNPSGILLGKDESGRPIYKSYKKPEDGVFDTQALAGTYLAGQGAMKGQKITPESLVGTWVNGDPTTGANVQGGKYVQTLRKELESAGVKLNADGTIPNVPEANAAFTRTLITHEAGARAKDFLPHVSANVDQDVENQFNAFVKQPTSATPQSSVTVTGANNEPLQQAKDIAGNPSDFLAAAGHHIAAPLHGGANLLEQLLASGVNKIAPNSDIAKLIQNTANADVEATKAWEKQYQVQTPTNAASLAGATIGEVLPALATGGGSMITQGGEQAANLAARLGLQEFGQGAAKLGGQAAGSAGLSAVYGLTQPTLGEQPFWQQIAQNAQTNAGVGAAIPLAVPAAGKVGQYLGNVAGAAIEPFTQNGAEKIAQNILNRSAGNKPINVINTDAYGANNIVPLSNPTLAELANNAGVSTLQRSIRDINPTPFVEREQANAAARLNFFNKAAENPTVLNEAINARDKAANEELSQLWANKSNVDAQPVLDKIDSILTGAGGERTSVKTVLNDVKSKLKNEKNTDPEYLYESVRKHIGDLLDPRAAKENPAAQQASRELLTIQDELDKVINKGVPDKGFDKYLSNYSASSKDIDAMKLMQRLNITDNFGNISLGKINGAINDIEKKIGSLGKNRAKSLDADQLSTLRSIRDDLQRQGKVGLGKSLGSNTVQNLVTQNMLETVLPGKLGLLASHLPTGSLSGATGAGVGYMAGGPVGAMIGAGVGSRVGSAWQTLMQSKNDAVINALTEHLLNPTQMTIQAKKPVVNPQLMELLYPSMIGVGTNSVSQRQ